jgi:DeoR/GlpR family transcriptional regulator of sugar metabolism
MIPSNEDPTEKHRVAMFDSVIRRETRRMNEDPTLASVEQRRLPARLRHNHLIEAARKRGFLHVADVAAELGVSEMTIRRDLVELEREGALTRTRGGAVLETEAPEPVIDREEPAFAARLRNHQEEKRRIATAAAELVDRRLSVAIDVGTTTHLLAQALTDRGSVKFFTSSLRTALLLGEAGREVYVPAGQVRGEEMSICGPAARAEFEDYWFDIAFIGVSGITAEGIYDYSLEDSELKRVYLRRAARKVVLCDSSKFRHMSLIKIDELSTIDLLICDAAPPADIAAALAAAEVEVQIAGQRADTD